MYCKEPENIESYDKAKADNFVGWCIHHRLETHTSDGERRLVDITRDELKALGMYYNRPASELIYLTVAEHTSLHWKGKHLSEDTRKKLSDIAKNMSDETKKKIGAASKGNKYNLGKHHNKEAKKKIGSAMKKLYWYNNGETNTRAKDCPPGFIPGRLRK